MGCGRVEVLAVGQLGRAEGVEDNVLALVVRGGCAVGRLDGEAVDESVCIFKDSDAFMRIGDVPGVRRFAKFLKTSVHYVECPADGEGGDGDADEEGIALLEGRGADKVAGLQILRRVARLGRCDADHAADGDG